MFTLLDAGIIAADDLLSYALPPVEVTKADVDPFSKPGFDNIVLNLLSKLKRAVSGDEKEALNAFMDMLDTNWSALSPQGRSKAIAAAGKEFLGLTRGIAPKVNGLLVPTGEMIVGASKTAMAEAHDFSLSGSLEAIDAAVIQASASHTALFVRDQFGARVEGLSAKAREIVAAGLSQGFDDRTIAKELRKQLESAAYARSNGYYRVIASTFAARSRTYGALSSLHEGGFDAYEIAAVKDEVTTDLCYWLDGKVFSVRSALQNYATVAQSETPEIVKDVQPWGSKAKDADGKSYLYVKQGGERVKLATVEESAVGTKDGSGSYGALKSDAELQALGLTSPPFHAHCRTTLIPSDASPPMVQVPRAVAPAPTPEPAWVPNVPVPDAAPTPLPDDIAALVRPVGTRTVDTETLPPYVPPPAPVKPARPPMSPEAQAIKDALAKLDALTPASVAYDAMGTPEKAPPGAVMHKLAHTKLDTNGYPNPVPYASSDITGHKLAGAKKQKPVTILFDEITMPSPFVQASLVKAKIEFGDPAVPIFVKYGGKLYPHGPTNSIVAHHLFGKPSIQGTIIDLDKVAKPKKVKAPPIPAIVAPPLPVAPAKTLDASVILHQLDGGAKGSNKGGFYTGADGVKRYVKFYDDPAQAHCEHLANSVYGSLGLKAPKSTLFEHEGKIAYASEIVPGKTLATAGLTKAHADEIVKGFAADILTANWDAVGTGLDNAFVLDAGGVMRIDNGGTFLMRAQAGRKPAHLLEKITEWDQFFSGNPYYAQVARAHGAGAAEEIAGLADQIKKVVELRDTAGGWDAYMARVVPGMPASDREAVAKMMEARTSLLEGKLKTLTAPVDKPKVADRPWPGRYVEPQKSTMLPRVGLTLADLPEVSLPDFYSKHEYGKLPSGEDEAAYETRARAEIAKISSEGRDAIKAFTGSDYRPLREAEGSTDAQLRAKGWPDDKIERYRKKAAAVLRAYSEATPEPGTVFRGIEGLDKAVHALYLENAEFGLGQGNKDATSSSTWNADIGIRFMGGKEDHYGENEVKILFIFRQKTGIAIQTISSFSTEKEVLLRANMRLRTTGLGRLKGTKRVLVVEAEEIDP